MFWCARRAEQQCVYGRARDLSVFRLAGGGAGEGAECRCRHARAASARARCPPDVAFCLASRSVLSYVLWVVRVDVLQTGSQVVPVVHRWEIIILITKMRDSHKKSPAASSVALVARGRADAANLGEPAAPPGGVPSSGPHAPPSSARQGLPPPPGGAPATSPATSGAAPRRA